MSNLSSENPGGSLNSRDREALGRHSYLGLLKYRDLDAGYCNACSLVYGIECPRCHAKSGNHGDHIDPVFSVERPLSTRRMENQNWVSVSCGKCDFRFLVIVH